MILKRALGLSLTKFVVHSVFMVSVVHPQFFVPFFLDDFNPDLTDLAIALGHFVPDVIGHSLY
jgi:hypothetical protein